MGSIMLLYLYAYRKGRREEMREEEISHSLVLDSRRRELFSLEAISYRICQRGK